MHKIGDTIIAFLPPETIEPEALEQIKNTASIPFLFNHVAVMPDTHFGKGSTVGTVLPTKGAIIPAAVGVDIGCGMIAVETTLDEKDISPEQLHEIRLGLERRIPMSAGKFNTKITLSAEDRIVELSSMPGVAMADAISKNWHHQLGTLGGGNHFIELCTSSTGKLWATLHSGSRGVGNQIGNMYIKKAQELCDKYFITLPDRDLAYLVEGTEEFDNYIRDMQWAQHFALLNREEMLDRFMMELSTVVFKDHTRGKELEKKRINCHHNFTKIEHHCVTCIDNQRNDNQKPLPPLADFGLSKVQDFLAGCQFLYHSCGGLLLKGANDDLISSALPTDVLEQMKKYLLAHSQELLKGYNHFVSSDLSLCVCQNHTVAKQNNDENKSDLNSAHHLEDEKSFDKLDKLLIGLVLRIFPYKLSIAHSHLHKNTNVWITRKGAIKAGIDDWGMIPGSMGTRSYIVRGKGNVASFCSAPHGAGRRMSRKKASQTFTMEDFDKAMIGIEHRRSDVLLDELPLAYKDVDLVIEQSKELIQVEHVLKQIMNVKGD